MNKLWLIDFTYNCIYIFDKQGVVKVDGYWPSWNLNSVRWFYYLWLFGYQQPEDGIIYWLKTLCLKNKETKTTKMKIIVRKHEKTIIQAQPGVIKNRFPLISFLLLRLEHSDWTESQNLSRSHVWNFNVTSFLFFYVNTTQTKQY